MPSSALEVTPALVQRIGRALDSVPRVIYSAPHVYPSAAPAYTPAPMAERPRPPSRPLRLYVHVPFCRYHCTFCHYAVRIGAGADVMARYVRALGDELGWVEPGTPLSQLFVGGGTPTALDPEQLDRVLETIFDRMPPHGRSVHTVETSPETISPAHVEVLRRRGIGRVSMGIQSLEGEVLDAVHREHGRARALEACRLLVDSGLIVNVDLIYGLPRQSEESFRRDLEAIAEQGVPSFTFYNLRTNERTPVVKALRDEERFDLARLVRWRAAVKRAAEDLGYTQTRWHPFKRLDSLASAHERLPCFDEDDMSGYQLGIGASARSHLGHVVYRNHDQINVYLDRVARGLSPVEQVFPLAEEDLITQFVARTIGDGKTLSRAQYARTFGRPIDEDRAKVLTRLTEAGLLLDDGPTIALSEPGKLVHDLVTLAFYPERARDWLAARAAHLSPSRVEPAPAST